MSKSYGKYKTIGVWYEAHANTEYYRCRRRSFRTKNRHIIRNMLANKSITILMNYIPILGNIKRTIGKNLRMEHLNFITVI